MSHFVCFFRPCWWLQKCHGSENFPKWQYRSLAINTDTELPQVCDDEKGSVEFLVAVMASTVLSQSMGWEFLSTWIEYCPVMNAWENCLKNTIKWKWIKFFCEEAQNVCSQVVPLAPKTHRTPPFKTNRGQPYHLRLTHPLKRYTRKPAPETPVSISIYTHDKNHWERDLVTK
jgi:hypothetical protein